MTTTKKPWWERELSSLDGELDDAPISSRWRSRLGEHALAERTKAIGANPITDRLNAIASRVARPANVVRNTEGADDRTLYIGWSDGSKVNDPSGSTIYLSPDAVMSARSDTVDEEKAVDAMTGQVLMAGTMKRTIHPDSWAMAKASGNKSAATIWRALESAIARQDVLKNWPGCADYFKRHAERTTSSKDEVQKVLDEHKPSLELAAAALAWNIQYPANKLTLSGRYSHAIDKVVAWLDREHRPDERFEMCAEAARMLEDALAEPPPPPPPPSPKPEEKPEGKGESDHGEGDRGENCEEPTNPEPKEEPSEEPTEEPPAPTEPESEESSERDEPESGVDHPDEPEREADPSESGDEPEPTEPSDEESPEPGGEPGSEDESARPDTGSEPEPEPEPEPTPEPTEEEEESKPEFEGEAPEVTDDSLFGGEVENKRAPADFLPDVTEISDEGNPADEIHMPEGVGVHESTVVNFVEESDPTEFNKMVREMQPQIRALNAALRFRNNDHSMWNRGCTSGDLDEGSLHKLSYHDDNPAIWERRELMGQPDVAVGVLLDESGSMCGKKIAQAKKVAVALTAALSTIKGIKTMVIGHTGDTCAMSEPPTSTSRVKTFAAKGNNHTHGQVQIFEYMTINHKNPFGLVHAAARVNNYDSFAMEYAVHKMVKDYQNCQRRVLFVISDGAPAGCGINVPPEVGGYGGAPAMKHMRQVCEYGRRHNVGVYGIGICNAYKPQSGDAMYGHGNYVVIQDVLSSLTILTAFIRQVSMRK